MTFDKEVFDAVEPVLRDLNLSNDAAQAVVNAYAEKVIPLIEARATGQADTMGAEMRRSWETAATAEFNGQNGNPTLGEVKALSRQVFVAAGIKPDSGFLKLID